jgi:hypothetical protein
VLIDTPGGDTAISRMAHGLADLIVTPMNDSFVDFDMLGHVDPVTMELQKPSLYSADRLGSPQGPRPVGSAPGAGLGGAAQPPGHHRGPQPQARRGSSEALSKRVGFRMGPGLRDRVIYRELFPFGLTIADLSPQVRPVAARRCRCNTWPRARSCGPDASDARAVLGVDDGASAADIKAAYTRLMRMAHPDKGGTAGLASQLNAARDRLLAK